MGLYSVRLIIGKIFASEILGAYLWKGLFLEVLFIGILRYIINKYSSGFLVQFRNNLLSCVFQKSHIARAAANKSLSRASPW